jgi:hypothetical protein
VASRWRVVDVVLGLATAGFAAVILVMASDPKTDGLTLVGLLVLSAIPLLCAAIALSIRACVAEKGARWRATLRGLLILLLHPAIIGAAVLPAALGWPFLARFELSRAALESAADEILMHHRGRNTVERIGFFRIESADTDTDGHVQFHLGECSWYVACDFVFHPKADCVPGVHRDGSMIDRHWCLERVKYF